MALTSAERSRRWRERQKQDPEKHQKYPQKEKQRYQERKKVGKLKNVEDLSEREKRAVRKQWRKNQQNKRKKDKETKNLLSSNTPPNSPCQDLAHEEAPLDGRTSRGRKKIRKDRSKAYREINKLRVKLAQKEKDVARYKKRFYRERVKNKNLDSPRTKTNTLIRGQKVSDEVKRTLNFHHSLVKGIREKYRLSVDRRNKELFINVLTSKLLRKYRLKKYTARAFGYSRKRVTLDHEENIKTRQGLFKRDRTRVDELQTSVRSFLQRDDNSRTAAGKKDSITRNKVKKQKRFLNDDLKNLHDKFLSEFPNLKLSYSLFCRFRPFWVLKATEKDRETCLCIKHENLQYQVDKLKGLGLISTTNFNALAAEVCCETESKACMYRECVQCKDKQVEILDGDLGKQVTWKKWASRRVEKVKRVQGEDVKYVTSLTMREDESGSVMSLVGEFQENLKKNCRHFFNIKHQYIALRTLRQNMTESEVLIHIDFSENYQCKYNREIQSVHFGANQNQVTLHTGVFYYKDTCTGFCTISDYNKHGPPAIWAHLKPILSLLRSTYPDITTVYFVSDGPTTQYRCKANFYLLSSLFFDWGFQVANWSFLEAGHGKGPADGIGGSVKRAADAFVLKGGSITNADSMKTALQQKESSIRFFSVSQADVEEIQRILPADLDPVPQTMKLHQVSVHIKLY